MSFKIIWTLWTERSVPKYVIMKVHWYLEWTLLSSSLILITLELYEATGLISAPKIEVIEDLHEFYTHYKDVATSEYELSKSAEEERRLRVKWVSEKIQEEQEYISPRCATGKLDSSVCHDPMTLDLDEGLQLLLSDTHFQKHADQYNLLEIIFKGGPDEAMRNADKADSLKKSWNNLKSVSWRLFWHIFQFLTFGVLITIQLKSTFFNGSTRFYLIVYMSTLITYSLYFTSLWIFARAENRAQILVYFWIFAVILNLQNIFYSSTTENQRLDPTMIFKLCASGKEKDRETLMKMLSNQTFTTTTDINSCKKGKSALHLAVEKNHLGIVQELIKTFGDKIDLSLCNRLGQTALDLAVINKNAKILKILLESPPQIATSISVASSMIIALKYDNTKMIQILMPKLRDDQFESLNETFQRIKDILAILKKKDVPNRKKLTIELECLKIRATNDLSKEYRVVKNSNENGEEKSSFDHECPICFETLIFPRKIFACTEDHLVCHQCLEKFSGTCHSCRQDFVKYPPKRRLDYESLVIIKTKVQ